MQARGQERHDVHHHRQSGPVVQRARRHCGVSSKNSTPSSRAKEVVTLDKGHYFYSNKSDEPSPPKRMAVEDEVKPNIEKEEKQEERAEEEAAKSRRRRRSTTRSTTKRRGRRINKQDPQQKKSSLKNSRGKNHTHTHKKKQKQIQKRILITETQITTPTPPQKKKKNQNIKTHSTV